MNLADADRALLIALRTRGHAPRLEAGAALLSRAGEHAAGWLALGVAGSLLASGSERRRAWRRGVRVVLASYGVNYLVKLAVRRQRPELADLPALAPTVSRLSFPSAHATTSFAAAAAYRRMACPALLYGTAVVVGVTRPYLGVHYPSDVLAGAVLGTIVARTWPQ